MRFERKTHALEGRCSIQLSYGTILNCAAKVGVFVELCKKKGKFLAGKDLLLYFLFVHLGSTYDVSHEIIGFTTAEVTVPANRIVEVFFIALQ